MNRPHNSSTLPYLRCPKFATETNAPCRSPQRFLTLSPPPPLFSTRIAVMYGSQTGNAQSIAEGVHEGLEKRGVESALLKCDAWKKVD